MRTLPAIAGAVVALFATSTLQAIELGSLSTDRTETGWTLDGADMTTTRAKLLNPANFGPGGTVGEAINITDLSGEITYTALSNFDVFYYGWVPDAAEMHLTEDEGAAIIDWINDGGTMIINCDDTAHDAICIAFALNITEDITPPLDPTPASANRPMFNGPFGQVTTVSTSGNQAWFSDTAGFSVLAEDQDGDPVILEQLIGNGRVIAMGDTDILSNYTLSDGPGISNDNDRYLGNLIAYLASEAGETFFINPGINGNWWAGPSRSGEGAQIEMIVTGEVYQVIVTFYSYDNEGNQIFLIALGVVNGNSAALDVFITEGGMWGPNFDPADVIESPAGTGLLTGFHCGSIKLEFFPNAALQQEGYVDVEFDMERLAEPAGPCPIPLQ